MEPLPSVVYLRRSWNTERMTALTVSMKHLRMLERLATFLLLASLNPAAYARGPGSVAECSIRGFGREMWTEASQFGHGLKAVPRSVLRPTNLK